MQSSRLWRAGLLCAASLTVFGSGDAPAQPQDSRAAAAQNYSRQILAMCSNVWTIGDSEELDNYAFTFNYAVAETTKEYAESHDALVLAVRDAEAQVQAADRASMGAALMAAAAREQSGGQVGVMSVPEATAMAATVWHGLNLTAYREAQQRVATLRAQLLGVERRLAGWRAVAMGVGECIGDQRTWLARGGRVAPAPVQPPAAREQDATRLRDTLAGAWFGKCVYETVTFPWDRRFSLSLDGRGGLSATFVEGSPATVTGSIDRAGKVQGQGLAPFDGHQLQFSMTGELGRGADGAITGKGEFVATDPRGVSCSGTWRI